MKTLFAGFLIFLLAAPVWAGETARISDESTFDFDQPFDAAAGKQVLRSLLNRALDVMEDHVEWTGNVRDGAHRGDREGRFEFRLYPQGKSRSEEHVGAEGSFRFSPEAGDTELSLRFKSSKDSSGSTASDPADYL
ncbi:MAG TPA: hypothetical protein VFG71_05710 [Nitrospiraceae bacterium]|nr:hypothetical protein [Nitrospiraceae bacterium]